MRVLAVLVVLLVVSAGAHAQQKWRTSLTEGDPVYANIAPGDDLRWSSTRKHWVVLGDADSPLSIQDGSGVSVTSDGPREFKFRSHPRLAATEAIAAYEITAVMFDVFGRFVTALSSTRMRDLPVGVTQVDHEWRVAGISEASSVRTSVLFVSRAITASGRSYAADKKAALEAMRAQLPNIDAQAMAAIQAAIAR